MRWNIPARDVQHVFCPEGRRLVRFGIQQRYRWKRKEGHNFVIGIRFDLIFDGFHVHLYDHFGIMTKAALAAFFISGIRPAEPELTTPPSLP